MAFDIDGARKAGYTDTEIADYLAKDSKFDVSGARQAGYSDSEIITHLRQPVAKFDPPKQEKGTGAKLQEAIEYLPRSIGLTGRAAVQGVGDTLDFLASPFRTLLNAGGMNIQGRTGQALADAMSLPTPETSAERIGGKGAEIMAGSLVPMGLANRAKETATGVTKAVTEQLSAKPLAQLTSAAGAGTAGEYTKETGGGTGAQLVASVVGGLAAPASMSAANSVKDFAARKASQIVNPQAIQSTVNVTIENALKDSGFRLSDIPFAMQSQLRNDVEGIIKSGGTLNQDALRRLIDYRLIGANPLKGNLTLNPADVTRQQNLGKIGINSQDPILQQIGMNANSNNARLIESLNGLGANAADDAIGAGQKVVGRLESLIDSAKGVQNRLYTSARESAGREVPLDRTAFVNSVYENLARSNKGAFLPAEIENLVNQISYGQITKNGQTFDVPFDVNTIDALKTTLANATRSTKDGNVKAAIASVRDALENTPIAGDVPTEAMRKFDQARRFTRGWEELVKKTPALSAARDGIEPDKFVQQFIIGNGPKSNLMDVSQLKKVVGNNEEASKAIRGQITQFLKAKALSGASDEVGNFSQAGYNKALQSIGEKKLSLFFTKEEIEKMKAIGRVASYEQVQPRGSAVNNSNTAGAAIGSFLEMLGNSPLLRKVPFGAEILGNPLKSVSTNIQAGQIVNPSNALLMPAKKEPFMLPGSALIATGGLLGS